MLYIGVVEIANRQPIEYHPTRKSDVILNEQDKHSGRFWSANTESFWKALPKCSLYPSLPDFIVHCILDFIPSITCRHQVQQDINIKKIDIFGNSIVMTSSNHWAFWYFIRLKSVNLRF